MGSSTKNVDIDVRLLEVELNSILKGWRIDTLQNPLFCIFFLLFSSLGCVIYFDNVRRKFILFTPHRE